MRIYITYSFLIPLIALAGLNGRICAEPLSGEQKENLLSQLKEIEAVVDGKRVNLRSGAVQTFLAASRSDEAAYEFYLNCHKKLRFDARDARFTEFRDWRDKNENRIKTKSNLIAMRLQLQYLVLTLRIAEGVERQAIIPELEAFVANTVSHVEDLGTDGLRTLRSSIKGTIFAQAYDLDQSLEVENWNYSPGDFFKCYDETVLPFFRTAQPEELANAWDRRINLEKQLTELTRSDNPIAMEAFSSEKLPRLYWAKARDVFLNASQQYGAAAMLNIIRTYTEHPDTSNWIDDLRDLLGGEE